MTARLFLTNCIHPPILCNSLQVNNVFQKEVPSLKNTVENMLNFYSQIRKVYINEFTRRFQEKTFSPNELDILVFLSNNPSINTASQLCTCLNVSKALICRSVDNLSSKELLICRPDENDRRIQHLLLTPKASPIIDQIRCVCESMDKELLLGISPEEIAQMEDTMNRILERFVKKAKGE